ncbi:MAG: GNAT family N-acetyltransferase [Thermoplasmata archaeon]
MIRDFQRKDSRAYFRLLTENFPEEEKVLGMRPEVFERIVRRLYRWDLRLLLGLARAFGRPLFRLFVIDEGGAVAASTILTFSGPTGYLSSVVVDVPFRRRGLARRLIMVCREATRKTGRKFVALDVLVGNGPARTLYEREGFQPIREQIFWVHEHPVDLSSTGESAVGNFRLFRSSDAKAIAAIATARNPREVNTVLPVTARTFTPPKLIDSALLTHGLAWVLTDQDRPVAYIRASVSQAMDAGHLSDPIFAPEVDPVRAAAFVAFAGRWVAREGARRVATSVPVDNTAGSSALAAGGFHEAFRSFTLFRTA